jgi:REP element-mobilizing transposase RayT
MSVKYRLTNKELSMSWNDLRKGRVSQSNGEYFITFACHNRSKIFNSNIAATTFCRQIKLNEQHFNCLWKTWVLMPDHFHGLLQLGDGDLSKTISHLKGLTSRRINEAIKSSGHVWQSSFYDRGLRAEDDRKGIARYIVANPLRAGLVDNVGDYPYWDSIYL